MKVVSIKNQSIPKATSLWRRAIIATMLSLLCLVFLAVSVTWAESPKAVGELTPRVRVGLGVVASSSRQIARTEDGYVYIAAVDGPRGQAEESRNATFLRMYKSTTAGIPTAFREMDRAHHARIGGKHTFSGGDLRLDRRGLIHLAYYRTSDGATLYRMFNTTTERWERAATVVTTFNGHAGNASYDSRGQVMNSIALDRDGIPYITVVGAEGVKIFRKFYDGWMEDATLSIFPSLHPAMTFDRLNRLHLVWVETSSEGSSIHYAMRDGAGVWGAEDIVFPGDANILSNVSPSLAVDSQNQPVVLYLSGEPGTLNNFVRTRVLTAGLWIADDPQDLFAYAPGLYMRGDIKFAVLGEDVAFHSGYLTHRPSDPEWSTVVHFEDREPFSRQDSSASVRYDPQYEVDCTVIDIVYSDKAVGPRGRSESNLYYTAIQLQGAALGDGLCQEVIR